jgi:hypothetical protein
MIYAIYPRGTFVNIARITLILLSIGLIVIAIWIRVYIIFALSLYLIFLALIIKERTLEIYEDRFVINSRCWLKRFNTKSEYCYLDIKKVRFSPGYTNWTLMILIAIMGAYRSLGEGGIAARSEWKIIKTDNSIEYIKSIGTDKEAEKASEYINSKIKLNNME